jgi:gamma-glutamylcyclotransferase
MNRRCPDCDVVGLGILRGWKWFIGPRRFANITGSPEDLVYGLVYKISPSDEATLDEIEGVPFPYTKLTLEIELQSADDEENSIVQCLLYVDEKRLVEGKPWEEYVHRINMGINDAVARGLPRWYIDKYIRRFVPPEEGDDVVETPKPEEAFVVQPGTGVKSKV